MSNEGKRVKVHYTGTLENGDKFDSSLDRSEPLEFVCMAGQMIPGFDKAVCDMNVGDKTTITIPAEEAYGERKEELVMQLPLESVPNPDILVPGEMIQFTAPSGQPITAVVLERNDTAATIDLNHELAGQNLIFEIELLSAS